jgi:hypothetical protein
MNRLNEFFLGYHNSIPPFTTAHILSQAKVDRDWRFAKRK